MDVWCDSFKCLCMTAAIIACMSTGFSVRVVGSAVVVSMFAFCAIFSVSGASDFRWHLESMERLLWVPALMLMYELTERRLWHLPQSLLTLRMC